MQVNDKLLLLPNKITNLCKQECVFYCLKLNSNSEPAIFAAVVSERILKVSILLVFIN